MRYPPGITTPIDPVLMIYQNPFVFGAKSLKKIKVTSKAAHYIISIGKTLSVLCMDYASILTDFFPHWKFLDDRKDEDEPDDWKISKMLKATQWSEEFIVFSHRAIRVQCAPWVCMIRKNSAVPVTPPSLLNNKHHSKERGFVER